MKYAFKTIVAPEAVRAEFTALRDSLNSSDKELMQAFWNIGIDQLEALKAEVANIQAATKQERETNRELKAAAKKKATGDKPAARKAKAEKAPVAKRQSKPRKQSVTEKVSQVESVDGEEPITIVVDL
jgi:peptidoglycan hydrolase CwlO-like protein